MGASDRMVWMGLLGGLSFRNLRRGVVGAKNYGESERYNEGRDPASYSLDSRIDIEGNMLSHRNPSGYVWRRANGYSGSSISDYLNKGRININMRLAARP